MSPEPPTPPPMSPRASSAMDKRATAARSRQRRRVGVTKLLRRRYERHRRIKVLALALIGCVLAVVGGSQVALAVLDGQLGVTPEPHPISADTLVYDRHGVLLADVHAPGDTRIPVPFDQIPAIVQNATIAIEDRSYWSEGAANPTRVAVAAVQNLLHEQAQQGASTIVQQLAKVRYLDDTKTYDRKVRELFIARNLQQHMTKQQILDEYLNDIYYGNGATGIEAASKTYFGISATKLDLAQAAMLAGLPNQPTELNPLVHPDAATARQQDVLRAMVVAGYISSDDAAAAINEKLVYADGQADNVDLAPAFVNRVITAASDQLHVDPYTAGLRITSTLDLSLQNTAQTTVTNQVNTLGSYNATDGALVSIDPQNGDVLAYVGSAGAGHPASLIDMASTPRQPGSTFKLFTYSTALANRKVTMTTPVLDGPFSLPTGGGPNGMAPYQVHDYDLRFHGVLPIAQAFANSLNVPAVKVELLTGIPNILKTARTLGVTTLDQPDNSYGASMTLGTYPVPLWQMAQAAGVFGHAGMLQPTRFMLSAKDQSGHELLPAMPKPKQVIDSGVAYVMNAILTDDTNRQLEFGLHSDLTLDNHLVSAKTGTTQDFRDNFTVGWTPHLVTAAWVGNADNEPMHGTTGITGAAPIWHAFMTGALNNVPDDWPSIPPDVVQGPISSTYSFRFGQTASKPAYYLTGTGPAGVGAVSTGLPACPVPGWSYMFDPSGAKVACGTGGGASQPSSLVQGSPGRGSGNPRKAGGQNGGQGGATPAPGHPPG